MAAGPLQHTHFSALNALFIFGVVVIVGTLWKLAALHLLATDPTGTAGRVGKIMLFQYS
jgi:hypothetical protein